VRVPSLPPQREKVLLEESPDLSTTWKIVFNSRGGVSTKTGQVCSMLSYNSGEQKHRKAMGINQAHPLSQVTEEMEAENGKGQQAPEHNSQVKRSCQHSTLCHQNT